jgi:integrase
MPHMKLTQKEINKKKLQAPHPSGRQTIIWDKELRGFGVLLSGRTNARTFVAQRDLPDGRTRRVTVASVSEISLAEAKDKARRLLLDMREGVDPKHRRAASATLRQTFEAYLAKNKSLSPRSVEIYHHLVLHHLEPWLDRLLSSITPGEVDDMHEKIAQTVAASTRHSGATTANDAMRALRLLYNWAASRDDGMPRNPVRLRRDEWHAMRPTRRPIPPAQLRAWYAAVLRLPPVGRDWLLLMLFTGLRRREAGGLRWQHLDLAGRVVRLPAAMTKSGRALDLPMTDVVHDLLVTRRALGNAGGWVLPSNAESGHVEDPRAFLDAVRDATGIAFSSHDLRRTYVTVAESCDVSAFALKALVNHSLGSGVTEGYIDMTVERLREPAQRVADRLKQLCGMTEPEGANVKPMGARRSARAAQRGEVT